MVFEAVKQFRKNKTTIVITHDLSQIVPDVFDGVDRPGVAMTTGEDE